MFSSDRLLSYYVRSALPFVSGLAFGLYQDRLHLPLAVMVVVGMVLVVVGPLAIQTVLALVVDALRGGPQDGAAQGQPPALVDYRRPPQQPTDLFRRGSRR